MIDTINPESSLQADSKHTVQRSLLDLDREVELASQLVDPEVPGEAQILDQLKSFPDQVSVLASSTEAKIARLTKPYVISAELEKALQISIILQKPLLLEGEPGTGKTSLPYALAAQEGLPIIHERGKSGLTAQSTLYEIDNVSRLRDVYLTSEIPEKMKNEAKKWSDFLENDGDPGDPQFRAFIDNVQTSSQFFNLGRVSDIRNYVRYGALGEAIIRASKGEKVILLIDEIDKAKREFSNDLLDEVEHMTMKIRETGEEISAPRENIIVVATSNHEKDLPEAFLRRCVYHYIHFPSPDQMTEIVRAHIPDLPNKLLESAFQRFYEIREISDLNKKPSTSEMLDWIRVCVQFGIEEINEETPFLGTLLKEKEDLDKVEGAGLEKSKKEKLKEANLPESVIAALHGETVVHLKPKDQWSNSSPDPKTLAFLANNGVKFTTESGNKFDTQTEFHGFDITADGIRNVGILTFAIQAGSPAMEVVNLLIEKGLVDRKFVVSEEPIEFKEILESTAAFIRGNDVNEREIYKTSDGKVVYQISLNEVMSGPLGGIGLTARQVDALFSAGIQTKDELFSRLKNGNGESLLNIDTIGHRALLLIKQAYNSSQLSRVQTEGDDEDDSGLGSETTNLINRSTLFNDSDDS